jgi:hypothetical protein
MSEGSDGNTNMSENGDMNPSEGQSNKPAKISYLTKLEYVLTSRERFFGVLSTITTALFTVILALSTVLLWKETKDLRNFAEQQNDDMKASIVEAVRSADAMREVAKSLAVEAEAAHANLRAYLTVGLGGIVPQKKETNYRFEVRMTLQNVGNTPAYKVASNGYADVLPNPLPVDFIVPPFNPALSGEATVGPHQNLILTAIAPGIYSDDDVNEIEYGSRKLLYTYGIVTYEDAFGISHFVRYCQAVLWLANNGGQMSRNAGKLNEAN